MSYGDLVLTQEIYMSKESIYLWSRPNYTNIVCSRVYRRKNKYIAYDLGGTFIQLNISQWASDNMIIFDNEMN